MADIDREVMGRDAYEERVFDAMSTLAMDLINIVVAAADDVPQVEAAPPEKQAADGSRLSDAVV